MTAFIFTGYGLALFGKLQRYQLYYVVFGIWIVQLMVSPSLPSSSSLRTLGVVLAVAYLLEASADAPRGGRNHGSCSGRAWVTRSAECAISRANSEFPVLANTACLEMLYIEAAIG